MQIIRPEPWGKVRQTHAIEVQCEFITTLSLNITVTNDRCAEIHNKMRDRGNVEALIVNLSFLLTPDAKIEML